MSSADLKYRLAERVAHDLGRRRFLRTMAAGAGALAAGSFVGNAHATGEPVRGGTLKWAQIVSPDTLDPHFTGSLGAIKIHNNLHHHLDRTRKTESMMISTGRPVTMGPSGMVGCPHALASQAGVDVLRAGGSAVDAAIAASAVLAVVYPHMTGIGGDAFWLIHDAKTGAARHLDGGGRASAAASCAWFAERGHDEVPFRGILPATLTTPGSVANWGEAHAAYGRLPLARCLDSAVTYATDGFPVTERLAGWIDAVQADLAPHPESIAIFMADGKVPRAGARLRNPDLGRTLQAIAIAADGPAGFYAGAVGDELLRFSAEKGGFFAAADLAAQTARRGEPLKGRYRDVTLYETPPPTQGFTVLSMLNLLAPFRLHGKTRMSPDPVHLMVHAKQVPYHDRDRFLGDPRFVDVPVERLISEAHADSRRGLMDPLRALPWDRVPSYGSLTGDTVFIAVVDAEGNAVSLIHSVYGLFGSGVVAGNTGVLPQNRGAYFSLDPSHPNKLEPGKTPMHTLIASMGFRDDKLWSVVGCMDADGQPQIHLQTYVNLIDYGLDIQARDTLHIESRFPAETIDELERRGHVVDRWGAWNELAGHVHGIVVDPDSGMRYGGSDPRSDEAAIGY